jgi:hypothetical protein
MNNSDVIRVCVHSLLDTPVHDMDIEDSVVRYNITPAYPNFLTQPRELHAYMLHTKAQKHPVLFNYESGLNW